MVNYGQENFNKELPYKNILYIGAKNPRNKMVYKYFKDSMLEIKGKFTNITGF